MCAQNGRLDYAVIESVKIAWIYYVSCVLCIAEGFASNLLNDADD
jgi:hypothetical protein